LLNNFSQEITKASISIAEQYEPQENKLPLTNAWLRIDFIRKDLISFGNQKINLHHVKSPFNPHSKNPLSGTTDICFLSSTPFQK
jgi:hypothetical protein